jgi:hypothetical protein
VIRVKAVFVRSVRKLSVTYHNTLWCSGMLCARKPRDGAINMNPTHAVDVAVSVLPDEFIMCTNLKFL